MLNEDFKEFAALLHSNRVEYLIVGGYALAAYGHPRYTGDLDFWVGTDTDNAQRVLAALAEFGFGALDELVLNFIGLDDFRINKKTTGRHKDLADLEALDKPPQQM